MKAIGSTSKASALVAILLLAGVGATTGCQVQVAGQTLPSAYYLHDDIQYFPKGPQMKLQREADALKSYNESQKQR
jgi:hypothetical protein